MPEERRLWDVRFADGLIVNKSGEGPPPNARQLFVRASTAGAAANRAQGLAKKLFKGERIQVSTVRIVGVIDD